MTVAPSPIPVQDTVLPYLGFSPSVVSLIVGGAAIVSVVLYVTQVLRMPKGTFWKRNFRFEPFVNVRLGVGSMLAMIVFVGLTLISTAHDNAVHEAEVEAQRVQEAAIQTEIKGALGEYYGVEFINEYDRIWSSARSPYDRLPGTPVELRMADGTERADCYVGHTGGFYVLSCGPEDATVPLRPVEATPAG